MDAQQQRPKPDRPIFIDIMLIGAAMAALLYSGARLLGETRIAWNAREAEKAKDAAVRSAIVAEAGHAEEARRQLERIQAERARIEAAQARWKNRRCVGNVLFAEVDGELRNVGRC